MFDHLFENRNKLVSNLIRVSDCIGRSLRENTHIFSIDSEGREVTLITESGHVITGNFTIDKTVLLENIKIQDSNVFKDNEVFDAFVNTKIRSFIKNLNEDSYNDATDSFDDVLSLWEQRLKFESVKERLDEKKELFGCQNDIVNTAEFNHLIEVVPQLCQFLSENKDDILNIPEIGNAVKLSNFVSNAFDLPRLNYKILEEQGTYEIKNQSKSSIYDLICKQELVKKEILESKSNFGDVWATNASISHLASLIYEKDEDLVVEALVEALVDVPYLALAKKRQISETIRNSISLGSDKDSIPDTDIKKYTAMLFEMKKPAKQVIVNILNEKYGINIQSLRNVASFKDLVDTQVVIFETLSRITPKNSILRETMKEVADMLKTKSGVEAIDINETLQEIFTTVGYESYCDDYQLVEELNFGEVLSNDYDPKELIELIKETNIERGGPNTGVLESEIKKLMKTQGLSYRKALALAGKQSKEGDGDNSEGSEEENYEEQTELKEQEAEEAEAEEAEEAEAAEAETEKKKSKLGRVPMTREEFLKSFKEIEDLLGDKEE